jgi:hypothetical protein
MTTGLDPCQKYVEMVQMTFLAHETLHVTSLDPTNRMLCLGRAHDPLGGVREALGGPGAESYFRMIQFLINCIFHW